MTAAPRRPGVRAPHLEALGELIGPGDLLIWDRGFFGYELIRSVVLRGAHLLARAKSNAVLRPIRRLDDGSYLAKIYPDAAHRRRDVPGPILPEPPGRGTPQPS